LVQPFSPRQWSRFRPDPHGYARAHRGDVDDQARPAAAHARQGRLDHRDRAEEARREQARHGLVFAFLDGGGVPVAGVVHQHVDAGEVLFGRRHGRADGRRVGDIKRRDHRGLRVCRLEVVEGGRVPCGGDDLMPGSEDVLCERAAESAGCSGDQPRRHALSSSPPSRG
jgi:hypothetical protein